jgi:hypothetical protein
MSWRALLDLITARDFSRSACAEFFSPFLCRRCISRSLRREGAPGAQFATRFSPPDRMLARPAVRPVSVFQFAGCSAVLETARAPDQFPALVLQLSLLPWSSLVVVAQRLNFYVQFDSPAG